MSPLNSAFSGFESVGSSLARTHKHPTSSLNFAHFRDLPLALGSPNWLARAIYWLCRVGSGNIRLASCRTGGACRRWLSACRWAHFACPPRGFWKLLGRRRAAAGPQDAFRLPLVVLVAVPPLAGSLPTTPKRQLMSHWQQYFGSSWHRPRAG